jgi:hypothetical protein
LELPVSETRTHPGGLSAHGVSVQVALSPSSAVKAYVPNTSESAAAGPANPTAPAANAEATATRMKVMVLLANRWLFGTWSMARKMTSRMLPGVLTGASPC